MAVQPGHCLWPEQRNLLQSAAAARLAQAEQQSLSDWVLSLSRRAAPAEQADPTQLTIAQGLAVLTEFGEEAAITELLRENLCPTCRLFGTVFWASPLLIPDLFLQNVAEPERAAREVRHGVGIDRDTGAAREAIKYDFEVLSSGYDFAFALRCTVPDDADLGAADQGTWRGLLALGLRLLELGEVPLGGRAARGVGRTRLTLTRVAEIPAAGSAFLAALIGAQRDGRDVLRLRPAQQWTIPEEIRAWVNTQLDALS
jgi:hypothetical protein